jgi:hypothetical protein
MPRLSLELVLEGSLYRPPLPAPLEVVGAPRWLFDKAEEANDALVGVANKDEDAVEDESVDPELALGLLTLRTPAFPLSLLLPAVAFVLLLKACFTRENMPPL